MPPRTLAVAIAAGDFREDMELFVVNVDGSALRRLTSNSSMDWSSGLVN